MPKTEAQLMADSIIRVYGKAYFTFGDVSEIVGCGKNTVGALFHDAGIIVKRVGRKKLVSALDIAEVMTYERIAPIDNTTRVCLTDKEARTHDIND
jgi:hypothetical protein